MKEELAALKKKRDAGDITAFKYRQGVRKIKEKHGKAAPSNVSKIMTYVTTKSPMDAVRDFAPKLLEKGGAKAIKAAKKRAAEQTARSDRQLIAKGEAAKVEKAQKALAAKSKAAGGKAVLSRKEAPKKRAAPKFNPSGLKVPAKKKAKAAPKKEKMYTAINIKTGKADFDAPKVTAAQRLKQEDKYKALNLVKKAVKSSMKKKKRG